MTAKAKVLQAIRSKCLDCSCFQVAEVRDCPVYTCTLWPYRLGRDPEPSGTRGFAKSIVYTGRFGKSAHAGGPSPGGNS